jgi:septal ring factor EnvC (AmiA/AmiB activator)
MPSWPTHGLDSALSKGVSGNIVVNLKLSVTVLWSAHDKRYKALRTEIKMGKYLLCTFLLLSSSFAFSDTAITTQQQTEYQRQINIYNEQVKKAEKRQAETEKQLKESAKLQAETEKQLKESATLQKLYAKQVETSLTQQKRMEKLLVRWEKQADRYDALLDKWEKEGR